MIVDPLRNDLSRGLCRAFGRGSLLCNLDSYASVHHLVSTVTGELAEDQDAVAQFRACFPGGSVTGALKVRSMEIIANTERVARESIAGRSDSLASTGTSDPYCDDRRWSGCVSCRQSDNGDVKSWAEYEETLAKARRLFDAFGVERSGAF